MVAWGFGGPAAVTALAVGLAATVFYGQWWRRRSGGLTGDAVGACGLAVATLALTALTAAVPEVDASRNATRLTAE